MGVVNSRLNSRVSPIKVDIESEINSSTSFQTRSNEKKFVLIWLEKNVDDNSSLYHQSIDRLRPIVKSIHKFEQVQSCFKFLKEQNSEKLLMVIDQQFLEEIWPKIRSIERIHSIYVISQNQEKLKNFDERSDKFQGIFTESEPIYRSLKENQEKQFDDQLMMSILPPGRYTSKDLSKLNHMFIYWMMVKTIIRSIKFDKIQKKNSMKSFMNFCRQKYFSHEKDFSFLKEFESKYNETKSISWLRKSSFISSMINRAFQNQDSEILIRTSFFIQDVLQQIEWLQQKTKKTDFIPLTLYRSQQISEKDLSTIDKIQGQILSFNNFLVADKNYERTMNSIDRAEKIPSMITLLFSIFIRSRPTSNCFVSLKGLTEDQQQDDFVIFTFNNIFRVENIEKVNENLYKIQLVLCESNDEDVHLINQLIRQETRSVSGWFKLAKLLVFIKDYDKARDVYQTLIDLEENPNKLSRIYNDLGMVEDELGYFSSASIYYQKAIDLTEKKTTKNRKSLSVSYNNIGEVQRQMGDYQAALSSHHKTWRIKKKILSSDDISMATTFNNIGLANEQLGEFKMALQFYERALNVKLRTLPADHQELAISYNNIGELHRLMGHFPEALKNLEKALKIRLKKYSPDDPSLSIQYNNIGLIYRELGNFSMALNYLQKSLDIKLLTLHEYHPSLTFTYNNIGDLQQQLGHFQEAIIVYEKALNIQEKALNKDHPELATTYVNMGASHESLAHYDQALNFYQKALDIRMKTLPSNHPSIGTCYNNIGHVQEILGKYQLALEFYQKTLKIQEKSLEHNHPSIGITYNNLADVNRQLGNQTKALELYKKSLEIKKKSLPPDHPSFIVIYNNIGVIHYSMENYSAALENYFLTLEIQKKSLPENHPSMSAIYTNIGVTYHLMKQYQEALEHYQKALEIQQLTLPEEHPDMAITYNSLATIFVGLGDYKTAMEYIQRALDISIKAFPEDHPHSKIFKNHHQQISQLVQSNQ